MSSVPASCATPRCGWRAAGLRLLLLGADLALLLVEETERRRRARGIEQGKVRVVEESIDFYGDRQTSEVVMELADEERGNR